MDHRFVKDQLYGNFARIGKAVSSPKRLEIMDLLSQGPRSVEDVASLTGTTVGNASAHLQVLYRARLVESRKDGQRVFYQLADPAVFQFLRSLEALGEQRLAEVDQLVRLYYEAPDELEPVALEELTRRLKQGDTVLIDVRPIEEYRAGHIRGALGVPVAELEQRLHKLPSDREIVAYCRGPYCLFAAEAVALLRERGFSARRLDGGFPDWLHLELPVDTAPAPV